MLLTSGQKLPRRRSRGPLPIAKVCTLVQFLLTFLQTCGIVCIEGYVYRSICTSCAFYPYPTG